MIRGLRRDDLIGKVMHNGSFRSTTRYVLDKEKATLLDTSMGGLSAETLTAEFMASKDLRPELKHPVWHLTLSLPQDESLTNAQFIAVGQKYLAGMILAEKGPEILQAPDYAQQRQAFIQARLPEYQYFQARHSDTDHEHLHIVASRINLETGKPVALWRDAFRSQHVIRGLEVEYGLTQVQNSWDVGKRAATKSQLEKGEHTGIDSVQSRLQSRIEQAATGQPEMPELFERLMREGINVRHQWTRTGKSKGISYELDGVAIPGNRLGSRYSFPGLQKHLGVSYQADRDDEKLRLLMTHGVSIEPEVDIHQRELSEELARSAMRILGTIGERDKDGRLVYSHERGNYTMVYSPKREGLVVHSKVTDEVILASRSGQVDVAHCHVTEEDLRRFREFEQGIERSRLQPERERPAKRDRGFER
jgi:Relaxase/Mobilisation nuclease domain